MVRPYCELDTALLDNPRFLAFMQTEACITYLLITSRALPRFARPMPGRDIPALDDAYDPDSVNLLVRIVPRRDISEWTGQSGQGWLCAEISAEHLHRLRPERAVELIQADIEQLAKMGLLEIHQVMLNGRETRALKVGEWVAGEPPDWD